MEMASIDEQQQPQSQLKTGWERKVKKHIFILSSSGKPIFTRYGDEQEMVTTFGLLQAVVSIVEVSHTAALCLF